MFTANKISSVIIPLKFESLNNGIWYYNYDITSETIDTEQGSIPQYSYILVRIKGYPTLSKCLESILKSYKDENNSTLYDILLTQGSNTLIEDIEYNIKVDFNIAPEKTSLEKAKEEMLRKIEEYDSSDNVNSFILNGVKVWLPKETRVGLMNSTTIEKNSGKEESTLWFNGICITVNCDLAILMLSALELYALECYNKTAEHKLTVNNMTEVSEIVSYDYTQGYPNKLIFTI